MGSPSGSPAKPHRAVVLGDKASFAQALDHRVDLAAADEVEFVGVDVEADTEALAGAADVGEDRVFGRCAKNFQIGRVGKRLAVARNQVACDIADIFALVAVLGHRRGAADLFEVTRAHGFAEQLHLASAVVEVVLARDDEAARLVHAGERVAEHRVAPVADGERPGRVGREKLHLHLAARADLRAPEALAFGRGAAQLAMPERRRHPEIDKPRARHARLRDFGREFQVGADDLGDRSRRLFLGSRHYQRGVASRVAVGRVLGRLDARGGGRRGRELAGRARALDSGVQDGYDQVLHRIVRAIVPVKQSCQIEEASCRASSARLPPSGPVSLSHGSCLFCAKKPQMDHPGGRVD